MEKEAWKQKKNTVQKNCNGFIIIEVNKTTVRGDANSITQVKIKKAVLTETIMEAMENK